ncbi:winged helix-turn-helix domain-containing protein [Solihabitans fulvus]|uniref:winged helix-turn-helix domain-containing protein n=1 Tax=Solihabitans fulvus TaxID=1892852 RepID=UPI001CB76549|nr:helix-turn-helix domain-containing protein [Solihabitans fulvus]
MTNEKAATALTHPVRSALLDLIRARGTVTSTEAARELGHSSGLCSFHLRQLARYGHIEEAGGARGRVRPWRLRTQPADDLGNLARELEDEGYQRWLRLRDQASEQWQRDEAFSTVLYLSPDELHEVADQIRGVLNRFANRETHPEQRPTDALPVAALARLFPLLPTDKTDDKPNR